MHKCACGCSQETKRDFTPGHDQKVIHDRIRTQFAGSTLRFTGWMGEPGPNDQAVRIVGDRR
ncbi:MAG: hypothetical protein JWP64_3598 [Pseudonocardia sp.]|nr:hypothetical protein [Pseudonocardia sp.]